MFNGKMVNERISEGIYSSAHISGLAPDTDKAIETVYLAALSRRPTDDELEYFLERFKERDEAQHSLSQLYWSLINSLEFSWNH